MIDDFWQTRLQISDSPNRICFHNFFILQTSNQVFAISKNSLSTGPILWIRISKLESGTGISLILKQKLLFQMENPKIVESELRCCISTWIAAEQVVNLVNPIVHQLMSISRTRFSARALHLRIAVVWVVRLVNARPFIRLQRVHPERIQIYFATFFVLAQALRKSNKNMRFSFDRLTEQPFVHVQHSPTKHKSHLVHNRWSPVVWNRTVAHYSSPISCCPYWRRPHSACPHRRKWSQSCTLCYVVHRKCTVFGDAEKKSARIGIAWDCLMLLLNVVEGAAYVRDGIASSVWHVIWCSSLQDSMPLDEHSRLEFVSMYWCQCGRRIVQSTLAHSIDRRGIVAPRYDHQTRRYSVSRYRCTSDDRKSNWDHPLDSCRRISEARSLFLCRTSRNHSAKRNWCDEKKSFQSILWNSEPLCVPLFVWNCPCTGPTWIFANCMDRKPFCDMISAMVLLFLPTVRELASNCSVWCCNSTDRWDLRSHPNRRTST